MALNVDHPDSEIQVSLTEDGNITFTFYKPCQLAYGDTLTVNMSGLALLERKTFQKLREYYEWKSDGATLAVETCYLATAPEPKKVKRGSIWQRIFRRTP